MRTPRGWKSCYTTDPPPCQKKGPCLFSLKDGGRSEYLRGRACNRRSLHRPGFALKSKKSGRGNCLPPSGSTGPYLALDRTQVLFHAAMIPTNWKNTGFFLRLSVLCCRLLRGHSLTKLTKFCSLLNTYLLTLLTLVMEFLWFYMEKFV